MYFFFFAFFFFLKPELNVDFTREAIHEERSTIAFNPHGIISNLFILNFGFCSLFLDISICFLISLYIVKAKRLQQFSIQCF